LSRIAAACSNCRISAHSAICRSRAAINFFRSRG
jgi:hypothetical protein